MTDLQRSFNAYIDTVVDIEPTDKLIWTYGFARTTAEVDVDKDAFVILSAERENYFRLAINEYAAVCNLTFTEVPTTANPDLRIAYNTAGGYSGVAIGNHLGSTLLFNTGDPIPKLGTHGFHTFLHELGHALGLRHGQVATDGFGGILPADHFSLAYSQVVYANEFVNGDGPPEYSPQTLGLDDIRSLQYRWGANFAYNSANTTYTWNEPTGAMSFQNADGVKTTRPDPILPSIYGTLWDGGGIDTYDLSNFTKAQSIDLRPGAWSTISPDLLPKTWYPQPDVVPGNLVNAYLTYDPETQLADLRSLIENVNAGSGNDKVIGNQADNVLNGNAGDDALYGLTGADTLNGGVGKDTLDGGQGADVMVGGDGDDLYYIDDVGDRIVETATGGADTIISSLFISLQDANYANVENLTLTGTHVNIEGSDAKNVLTGNSAANLISGFGGSDKLLGLDGADTLVGGDGDDTLDGGSGADTLKGDAGNDTLDGGAEDDTLFGGDGRDSLDGGSGADTLEGNAGNDTLDGGAGDDLLRGGAGDDVYLFGFGSGKDTIIQGDGGLDRLVLGVGVTARDITWTRVKDNLVGTLTGGADQITLTDWFKSGSNTLSITLKDGAALPVVIAQNGSPGPDDMTGTGQNDLLLALGGDDKLTGGLGDDILDGGAGKDTMDGGQGNDIFYVDDASDVIEERSDAGSGTDTVVSSIDYSLDGTNLENLILTGTALRATGSGTANIITGNDGDNIIDGLGGDDRMSGGKGNDTYYVDSLADQVNEIDGQGTDTVIASVNGYTLAANVETLTLASSLNMFGSNGTGNSGDNTINGNDYVNVLIGMDGDDTIYGGGGADTLYGSAGADSMFGGDGDDSLQGGDGDDTLDGGAGNDFLGGNAGNNTYYFGKGYGTDTISRWGANTDKLIFKGIVSADEITWSRATPTSIELIGTLADGSKVILTNWFHGPIYEHLEIYLSNGTRIIPTIPIIGSSNGETLEGTKSKDLMQGLGGDDTLNGGDSDDTLDGGAGADSMSGGGYDDLYYVDDIGDVVTELAGQGTDTVISSLADYTLTAEVENLQLAAAALNGSGNASNNVITGNALANILMGLDGNDSLDGGAGNDMLIGGAGADRLDGGSGADSMSGGDGDDTYIVDDISDKVIEVSPALLDSNGKKLDDKTKDTIIAMYIDWSLKYLGDIENLTLIGTQINLTGNGRANRLTGNAADNIIDGGSNEDVMIGGLGDDTYYVDNIYDQVIENAGEGEDNVYSSVSYTLQNTQAENLVLQAQTAAIYAKGNALANRIIGNEANNVLIGAAGIDTMEGGKGDDLFYVEDQGDVVKELVGEGTDTVATWINNYTLTDNVENLTLVGDIAFDGAPNIAIRGNGNALNNYLLGNGQNNLLYGYAGNDTLDGAYGADSLYGGVGDDTYVVDSVDDVVEEQRAEGTDTIQTSLTSYALGDYKSSGSYVENLTYTGASDFIGKGNLASNKISGGVGDDQLYGDRGDDTIYGGGGDDKLMGEADADQLYGDDGADTLDGGAGNDILQGGAGDDSMVGGLGDDTYYVEQIGDTVVEAAGQGTDLVISSLVDYRLADHVENLRLADIGATNGVGNALDNVITGNALANKLSGLSGDDILDGKAGNDALDGGDGNDTLIGGTGADTLYGGSGDDVYVYNRGDGLDTISDDYRHSVQLDGGQDTLRFDDAIAQSDLWFAISGADLIIGVKNPANPTATFASLTDKVTLKNWFTTFNRIETIRFADNSTLNVRQIVEKLATTGNDVFTWVDTAVNLSLDLGNDNVTTGAFNDTIDGGGGNDALNGGAGDDRLIGGLGADTLYGGLGNDVYVFNRGDGFDTIYDDYGSSPAQSAGSDVLSFGADILKSHFSFSLSGADLIISVSNPGSPGAITDKITLKNWTDPLKRVETLSFGDGALDARGVAELLVTSGNDTFTWTETAINWNGGAGADRLTTGAFNDTLTGGAGNDTLDGGAGYDIGLYSGAKSEYAVAKLANGSYSITDKTAGRDGVDTVTNIEALKFTDGLFNIADLSAVANSTPVISSPANVTVVENVSTSTVVYQVSAFDPDPGSSLSYSILPGPDKAAFTIDPTSGGVKFVSSPDYEVPADAGADHVYNIVVQASDGTRIATQSVTIAIANALEAAPTITSQASKSTDENVATTTGIYQVSATDPAGAPLTYSLTGGADKGLFTIDPTTGVVKFTTAPDYESALDANHNNDFHIEVTASNGAFTTKASVLIKVNNVNEAPSILSATATSVAENVSTAATVYKVTGVDPEGQALTYALSGGPDKSLFTIDPDNGAVRFINSPNFEAFADNDRNNIYQIEVQASDGSLSTRQSVTITVTDVNEAPFITSAKKVAVNANRISAGTPVYTASFSDPDTTTTPTYSITGGSEYAYFNIDPRTGAVTFKTPPDFANPTDKGENNVYDIVVSVSDGTLRASQEVSITLTNMNATAPVITSEAVFYLAEHISVNDTAFTIKASDVDAGAALTYSIVGGPDKSMFRIDPNTGKVNINTSPDLGKPFDYGGNNIYEIAVQASDGLLLTQQSVTIMITDVNNNGLPHFSDADMIAVKVANFTPGAGGWSSNTRYPRSLVDINNDGRLDLVGFGEARAYAALGNGNGTFGAINQIRGLDSLTPVGGGWNSNNSFPRLFADVNGDGRVDAVGFGYEKVFISLGVADGSFGPLQTNTGLDGLTTKGGGWTSADRYPRFLADVTGDGKVDVLAFGESAVYLAIGNGDGTFQSLRTDSGLNGYTPQGGGWNSYDQFPRMLGDVDGDGKLDVIGFGWSRVFVSLGNGDGTFQPMKDVVSNFTPGAGGWVNNTTYPRLVSDMNGDGMADLVGFGEAGVYVALATGGGEFDVPRLVLSNFGRSAGGWTSNDLYLRLLGDLNGDRIADIVGFGQAGVYTTTGSMGGVNNVIGTDGNDVLAGDYGHDIIIGGLGADTMTGRAGADTFMYTSLMDSAPATADTITDFQSGSDKIDLKQIDANTNRAGDQSFTFIGAAAFSRVAGELNYIDGILSGDVNGDGVADFNVTLSNKAAVNLGDLVL